MVKGKLPIGWRRYTVPNGCTVIQWVSDFSQRMKQLQQVSQLVSQRGANQIKVSYLIIILVNTTKIVYIIVTIFFFF